MQRFSPKLWPWLRARLFPRGTNLIQWVAFLIVIVLMVIYVLQPPAVSRFQFNATMLAMAVLLVINIVWDDLKERFSNPAYGIWALLLASTALAFFAIIVGRMYIGVYLLFMIVAQANAMLPVAPALTLTLLLMAGYLGVMVANGVSLSNLLELTFSLLIGFTFTATLSQVLNRYSAQSERMERLLDELQQANLALIEAGEKEKELTIAEERLRMARDLHDGLGHHLTALSVQLQAAQKLMLTNPELAAGTIGNARGEIQAALKEVRQSVAALRDTPVNIMDLPQAVERLTEQTGQLTGLQARFSREGDLAALTTAAAMTIYRAAQEGLTNVRKHSSGATCVEVRLRCGPAAAELSVDNDGVVLDGPYEASGFGLAGLRERAALLGGSLSCGPRPQGGFNMTISLPIKAQP